MATSQSSLAEAFHEAHTVLFSNLRNLDEAVRPESQETLAGLRGHLQQVRTHLLDHFQFEEQGGYMAAVLKEEPRLEAETRSLLEEHRQLAQTLETLVQEISRVLQAKEQVREWIRDWLKQLRHHESRENRLVQEAFYSGGATGD